MSTSDLATNSLVTNNQQKEERSTITTHPSSPTSYQNTGTIREQPKIMSALHQRLHKGWKVVRVGTAKCDMCNKQSRGVVQTCKECGLSICSECNRADRLSNNKNHELLDEEVDWSLAGAKSKVAKRTTRAIPRPRRRIKIIRKRKAETPSDVGDISGATNTDNDGDECRHTSTPEISHAKTTQDASTQTDSFLLEMALRELSKSTASQGRQPESLSDEERAARILVDMPNVFSADSGARQDNHQSQNSCQSYSNPVQEIQSQNVSFAGSDAIQRHGIYNTTLSEQSAYTQDGYVTLPPISTVPEIAQFPANYMNTYYNASNISYQGTSLFSPYTNCLPVQNHGFNQHQHPCSTHQAPSARHYNQQVQYQQLTDVENNDILRTMYNTSACGSKRRRKVANAEPPRLFTPSFIAPSPTTNKTTQQLKSCEQEAYVSYSLALDTKTASIAQMH